MKKNNIIKIFTATMAFLYVIVGLWILFARSINISIEGSYRTILGIVVLMYGFYRCFAIFRTYKGEKTHITILLILFAISLFSCQSPNSSKERHTNSDTVNVYVDETFKPVIEAGYNVFSFMDTLAVMNVFYVPEEEAFSQILRGNGTMAIVSRPLALSEEKLLNAKTIYSRQTRIAEDAIAVIVNRSLNDSIVTVKQIREILTGRITNWKQLFKNHSDQPIRILFDNPQSGIVRYMVDSVCQGEPLNSKSFALNVNTDVVEYVSTNPDVIGFIGTSWISNSKDSLHLSFHSKIKVMYISKSDKPSYIDSFQPYQAYILDGVYPFTRNIYMINAEPNNGKATRFSNFMAGAKGQRIILKSGILPAVAPTRLVNVRSNI